MKQFLLCIMICMAFSNCKTKKTTTTDKNEYGYSKSNPIKVGGVKTDEGLLNEREYLRSLVDLEGNDLSFYRIGSCCSFKTSNSGWGSGMLDIYTVYIEGKTDTVHLYLNMYDEDKLYAPKGFRFKM